MIRVVADTNIIVSASLWYGKPYQLLRLAVARHITLVTSAVLVTELTDVLSRPRFASRLAVVGSTYIELIEDYCASAEIVQPAEISPTILADPDDDAVLACALGGAADYIISGNDHLLNLKPISISELSQFIAS